MPAFDEGEKEMSKKAILFLVVLFVLTFLAYHTGFIEQAYEAITGDYTPGIGCTVEGYLLIVVIGLLLRKRSS